MSKSRPKKQSKGHQEKHHHMAQNLPENIRVNLVDHFDRTKLSSQFFMTFPPHHAGVIIPDNAARHQLNEFMFNADIWQVYDPITMGDWNGVYCKMTFGLRVDKPRVTVVVVNGKRYLKIVDLENNQDTWLFYFGETGGQIGSDGTFVQRFAAPYPTSFHQKAGQRYEHCLILINRCLPSPSTNPDRYFSRHEVICMVEIFLLNLGMYSLFTSIYLNLFKLSSSLTNEI